MNWSGPTLTGPSISMALKGQTGTQRPQKMHFSSTSWAVRGSFSMVSRARRMAALAAAASPWATASRTSLGAWAAPQRKMPGEPASTGPSLGGPAGAKFDNLAPRPPSLLVELLSVAAEGADLPVEHAPLLARLPQPQGL